MRAPLATPTGSGRATSYLGAAAATTNASGDAFFTASLSVPSGQIVTATATDPSGNTSEFSQCAFVLAQALAIDAAATATSDGNGVLEAGETVAVTPTWRNATTSPFADVAGATALFGGPGAAAYTLTDSVGGYGTFLANQAKDCAQTADCYGAFVSVPPARPAPHWDATLTETLRTDVVRVVAGPEDVGPASRRELF